MKIVEIVDMLKEKQKYQEESRKMKLGEIKMSKFGFGFELSGFVAFLGWAGMCLYSLLGLIGLALITVPRDFPSLFRGSGIQWNVNLMNGNGIAFLVIAVGFFPMNFFLRKKNKENDFKGVKKMLTTICSNFAGLLIGLYFVPLVWFMYEILNGILAPQHFSIIILFPSLVFKVLLLHGIKNEKSGFVKPFLIFHYTLYLLFIASVAVMSICCAVFYGMFTIVLCGLLYIMIVTFLFIFYIGFYVALHSIYVEMEKSQQQMKKNIEFIKCHLKSAK